MEKAGPSSPPVSWTDHERYESFDKRSFVIHSEELWQPGNYYQEMGIDLQLFFLVMQKVSRGQRLPQDEIVRFRRSIKLLEKQEITTEIVRVSRSGDLVYKAQRFFHKHVTRGLRRNCSSHGRFGLQDLFPEEPELMREEKRKSVKILSPRIDGRFVVRCYHDLNQSLPKIKPPSLPRMLQFLFCEGIIVENGDFEHREWYEGVREGGRIGHYRVAKKVVEDEESCCYTLIKDGGGEDPHFFLRLYSQPTIIEEKEDPLSFNVVEADRRQGRFALCERVYPLSSYAWCSLNSLHDHDISYADAIASFIKTCMERNMTPLHLSVSHLGYRSPPSYVKKVEKMTVGSMGARFSERFDYAAFERLILAVAGKRDPIRVRISQESGMRSEETETFLLQTLKSALDIGKGKRGLLDRLLLPNGLLATGDVVEDEANKLKMDCVHYIQLNYNFQRVEEVVSEVIFSRCRQRLNEPLLFPFPDPAWKESVIQEAVEHLKRAPAAP